MVDTLGDAGTWLVAPVGWQFGSLLVVTVTVLRRFDLST
jgi:hypothetical protein